MERTMAMILLQEIVLYKSHTLYMFTCQDINCRVYGTLLLLSDIQEQNVNALVSFPSSFPSSE